MYRIPFKIHRLSSFHVRFNLSCWYLFHQLAFHQSLVVEASRFPEACVTERPTFLISWFSMMPLYGLFPIVQDQDGTCWASWGSSRHFICGFRPASSIHANNGPLLISTCPVAGWIFSLTECEAFAPPSPWIPKTINVIHRSGGSGNALHELLDYLEAIKNRHFCTYSWWHLW